MGFLVRKTMMCAAAILAVLYIVCFLAPIAAVAFSHSPGAAHCLTAKDHGLVKSHSHDSAGEHQHTPASTDDHDSNQASANCCSVFCVTGLTSVQTVFEPGRLPQRIAKLQSFLPLVELGPERPYKPPISFLS